MVERIGNGEGKMCKWGDKVNLVLKVPAALSHTGKEYMKPCGIDRCIAPIVKALNDGGVVTVASCCGHERGIGNIALADGRELIIAADYKRARELELLGVMIKGKER